MPVTKDETYEVYAIKYGRHDRLSSANFIGGDSHETPMPLDYYMHYDHAGNRDLFPKALCHLQDREMTYCTGSITPGLSVHLVGGHTNGPQAVRVRTEQGWLVLVSDASHLYANMEQARPFPAVCNVGDML